MTPESFFRELLPRAWNVRESGGGSAQRVSFALEVRVQGSGGGSFHLRVKDGEMLCSEEPDPNPLLQLVLGVADFDALIASLGSSPLALLDGFGSSRGLTPARVAALEQIRGGIRLEVGGEPGWGVFVHYGPGTAVERPDTTISLPAQTYAELREGRLDLQGAFLAGKLKLEGDLDLALRAALAFMTR